MDVDDIKKLMKTKKAVIGTEQTLKDLRAGKLKKVYLTSNCPSDIKVSIGRQAKMGTADVVQLPLTNNELGVICKKQFAISVLSELN